MNDLLVQLVLHHLCIIFMADECEVVFLLLYVVMRIVFFVPIHVLASLLKITAHLGKIGKCAIIPCTFVLC